MNIYTRTGVGARDVAAVMNIASYASVGALPLSGVLPSGLPGLFVSAAWLAYRFLDTTLGSVDFREDCTEAGFVMSGLASADKCHLIVERAYDDFRRSRKGLDAEGAEASSSPRTAAEFDVSIEDFILRVVQLSSTSQRPIDENGQALLACLGLPIDEGSSPRQSSSGFGSWSDTDDELWEQ